MRRNDFFASVGAIIEKILENVNKNLKISNRYFKTIKFKNRIINSA